MKTLTLFGVALVISCIRVNGAHSDDLSDWSDAFDEYKTAFQAWKEERGCNAPARPQLVPGESRLPDIAEDVISTLNQGVTVASILKEAAAQNAHGIAVMGQEHFQVRRADTTRWVPVSADSLTFIDADDSIRFKPPQDFYGGASTSFFAWSGNSNESTTSETDAAASSYELSLQSRTLSISVTPVNDSPVVRDGTYLSLKLFYDNVYSTTGVRVSDIVSKMGVVDVDTPQQEIGIAIYTGDRERWQYRSNDDGAEWKVVEASTSADSVFLKPDQWLRIVPSSASNVRRDGDSRSSLPTYASIFATNGVGLSAADVSRSDGTIILANTAYGRSTIAIAVIEDTEQGLDKFVGDLWPGYDVRIGKVLAASPYVQPPTIKDTVQQDQLTDGKMMIAFSHSESTRQKSDSIAVDVQGSYMGFSAAASVSSTSSSESTSESVGFNLFISRYVKIENVGMPPLTDLAKALARDNPSAFIDAYGTHMVLSKTYGCSLTATGNYQFSSSSSASTFKESVSASYGGGFGVSAAQSYDNSAKSADSSSTVTVSLTGDFATDGTLHPDDPTKLSGYIGLISSRWDALCVKTNVVKKATAWTWADHPDILNIGGDTVSFFNAFAGGDDGGGLKGIAVAIRTWGRMKSMVDNALADMQSIPNIANLNSYPMGKMCGASLTGPSTTAINTLTDLRTKLTSLKFYDSDAKRLLSSEFSDSVFGLVGIFNQRLLELTYKWTITMRANGRNPPLQFVFNTLSASDAASTSAGIGVSKIPLPDGMMVTCGKSTSTPCSYLSSNQWYQDNKGPYVVGPYLSGGGLVEIHGIQIAGCMALPSDDYFQETSRPPRFSGCQGLWIAALVGGLSLKEPNLPNIQELKNEILSGSIERDAQSSCIHFMSSQLPTYGDIDLNFKPCKGALPENGFQYDPFNGRISSSPVLYGFCDNPD